MLRPELAHHLNLERKTGRKILFDLLILYYIRLINQRFTRVVKLRYTSLRENQNNQHLASLNISVLSLFRAMVGFKNPLPTTKLFYIDIKHLALQLQGH